MKKIFLYVFIVSFFSTISNANTNRLNFKISKAIDETEVIRLNENYSVTCESNVVSGEYVTTRMRIDQKVLKHSLVLTRDENDIIYVNRRSKIKNDGKISPGPVGIKYAFSIDVAPKGELKKLGDSLKKTWEDSDFYSFYGRKLSPVAIEDKKTAKQFLSVLKKMFANNPDIKKALKKLKVVASESFLGTASIKSKNSIDNKQNFYAITNIFGFKHPDKEVVEAFTEMYSNISIITLIHIDSGFPIELPITKDDGKTCKIKKDNSVIFEIETGDLIN